MTTTTTTEGPTMPLDPPACDACWPLEPPAMPGEECLACGHTFSGGETVHACAGGAVR